VEAKLHLIKHSITSVLCVPNPPLERKSFQKCTGPNRERDFIFIFDTTIIHRGREPFPWVALRQPIIFKKNLHQHRRHIVTPLSVGRLAIGIAIHFLGVTERSTIPNRLIFRADR
jgi:hypothetical protein